MKFELLLCSLNLSSNFRTNTKQKNHWFYYIVGVILLKFKIHFLFHEFFNTIQLNNLPIHQLIFLNILQAHKLINTN